MRKINQINRNKQQGKIKILEISNYPPPHLGWGVRVRFLRERLLQEGHSCAVLNIGENRKVKSTEYEDIQGGFDLLRKLVRYLRRGYLVHMHACGDSPKGFVLAIGVELISCLLGKRPILTFHAGVIQIFFPKERSGRFRLMFNLIFMLPKVIICNSEEVKEKIVEYGISEKKVFPIPAFSAQYLSMSGEQAFPGPFDAFLKKYKEIIATSLRFDPRYYVDVLLKAFAQLKKERPEFGLVITGPLEGLEETKAKFSEFNIKESVFVVGDLEHDLFLKLFKRSKIYIRTPITDGVSSSVMEALSLGLPVIASENGTRPKSVITYPAENVDALYQEIVSVLDRYDDVKASLQAPVTRDTMDEEMQLMIQTFYNSSKHLDKDRLVSHVSGKVP